jgi:hypothetical protein
MNIIHVQAWNIGGIYGLSKVNECADLSTKQNGVTGEWRRLHNTELCDLFFSPNVVRVIKSRRMRWAGHMERLGDRGVAYRVLVGRPEGKRPLG